MKNSIFEKGLSLDIIHKLSEYKHEDKYMLSMREKAFYHFLKADNPHWSKDIPAINFDDFIYFNAHTDNVKNSWSDIPQNIKDTFEKMGIMEAEAKYLSGVSTQYDSEVIYHNHKKALEIQGVIFCDTDTAYRKYPDLFKKYFGKLVPHTDNKYAALNSAVWSGGSFIYVPKNTHLKQPLQSYFRINTQSLGQFERTLIIVDENSSLHYIEGCTAPIYTTNNLHAAVVEIFVEKNAHVKYTTIQNWSANVLNYVTKRALVKEHGSMTWVDGNIGAKHNIKFPTCILAGEYAIGNCISIAIAAPNIIQDTGAKMIHLAPFTKSSIISKSIGHEFSKSIFRGLVDIRSNAHHSLAKVQCDTLLLSNNLRSETIPFETLSNTTSTIEHEASVTKISEAQLDYLMSRGINKNLAQHLIVLGFIDIFTKELPMEYAVELNRLLKLND